MGLFSKWKGTALGAVAAPFTGGLSLAGGYLYDTNKQQNEANKKAIDRANAYDRYTWDLVNQYNDPKAQMERLKAAGLNPNLVYGSGNVTGNTAGVASSNGVASQEVFNGISKGLPLAQGLANLRNTNNQNQLLQYQMGQTAAQTAKVQAETKNLNNFLTGNGPSTYQPIVQKNVEGLISSTVPRSAKKLYNYLTRPSTSSNTNYFRQFAEGVGDFFWRINNRSRND